MNSHFLLPCECGQSVPIQISQAGQSVTCSCGRTLSVPSMRGIRQLKMAEDADEPSKATRTWDPTRGMMFGTGAVLILVGFILVGFNYPGYRNASDVQPTKQIVDHTLHTIDESSPEQLWTMWQEVTTRGLGEHDDSIFVYARSLSRRLFKFIVTGAVFVGVGILLVIATLLMPGRKVSQAAAGR